MQIQKYIIVLLFVNQIYGYYPSSYDVRQEFNYLKCKFDVKEEGTCVGSWALSIASTIENLRCGQNEQNQDQISAEHLLNCLTNDAYICQLFDSIDILEKALDFIVTNGLTTNKCVPFKLHTQQLNRQCVQTCVDGQAPIPLIKMQGYDQIYNPDQVKDYLMNTGPLIVAVKMNQKILQYQRDLKSFSEDLELGLRTFKIVGWNTDAQNKQYWIAANSWGSSWGNNGYYYLYLDDEDIIKYYAITV